MTANQFYKIFCNNSNIRRDKLLLHMALPVCRYQIPSDFLQQKIDTNDSVRA